MVRHGYHGCVTCHVSPTGGGILNPYGRVASEQHLSMSSYEGEGAALWGIVTPPSWLSIGGNVRALADYSKQRSLNFLLMQAEVELEVQPTENLTVVGTLGRHERDHDTFQNIFLYSRRHYVLYKVTPDFSVRFGRFFPAVGIQHADHTIVTKHLMGWHEGGEIYNLELAASLDSMNVFITGLFGRFDTPGLNRDRGIAVRASGPVAGNLVLGGTYLYGNRDDSDRHMIGPFALLGFSPQWTLLLELDLNVVGFKSGAPGRTRLAFYAKLDYEAWQGVHFFLSTEYYRENLADPSSNLDAFGVGLQFFPRPHFELFANYKWRKDNTLSQDRTHFVFLVGHIYL